MIVYQGYTQKHFTNAEKSHRLKHVTRELHAFTHLAQQQDL